MLVNFSVDLGRLNIDELYDTSEIKYIFTKKFESRIFMANFDEAHSCNIMDKIISKIEEMNISALWYVFSFFHPSNLKNLLNEYGFVYHKDWAAMAINLNSVNENFETPKGIEIKKVSNIHELATWTHILTKSFDIQGTKVEMYKKYFLNLGIGNI